MGVVIEDLLFIICVFLLQVSRVDLVKFGGELKLALVVSYMSKLDRNLIYSKIFLLRLIFFV